MAGRTGITSVYHCGYGVADSAVKDGFRGGYGGRFDVYYNVFQGSTIADIAGGSGSISIRNNYSSGSNQFYANADAQDIVIQDNTILETTTMPIYSLYGGIRLVEIVIEPGEPLPPPEPCQRHPAEYGPCPCCGRMHRARVTLVED